MSTISTKPTSGFRWDEDSDDDFNLEEFMAKSSTLASAPTLEELGPLQRAVNDEQYDVERAYTLNTLATVETAVDSRYLTEPADDAAMTGQPSNYGDTTEPVDGAYMMPQAIANGRGGYFLQLWPEVASQQEWHEQEIFSLLSPEEMYVSKSFPPMGSNPWPRHLWRPSEHWRSLQRSDYTEEKIKSLCRQREPGEIDDFETYKLSRYSLPYWVKYKTMVGSKLKQAICTEDIDEELAEETLAVKPVEVQIPNITVTDPDGDAYMEDPVMNEPVESAVEILAPTPKKSTHPTMNFTCPSVLENETVDEQELPPIIPLSGFVSGLTMDPSVAAILAQMDRDNAEYHSRSTSGYEAVLEKSTQVGGYSEYHQDTHTEDVIKEYAEHDDSSDSEALPDTRPTSPESCGDDKETYQKDAVDMYEPGCASPDVEIEEADDYRPPSKASFAFESELSDDEDYELSPKCHVAGIDLSYKTDGEWEDNKPTPTKPKTRSAVGVGVLEPSQIALLEDDDCDLAAVVVKQDPFVGIENAKMLTKADTRNDEVLDGVDPCEIAISEIDGEDLQAIEDFINDSHDEDDHKPAEVEANDFEDEEITEPHPHEDFEGLKMAQIMAIFDRNDNKDVFVADLEPVHAWIQMVIDGTDAIKNEIAAAEPQDNCEKADLHQKKRIIRAANIRTHRRVGFAFKATSRTVLNADSRANSMTPAEASNEESAYAPVLEVDNMETSQHTPDVTIIPEKEPSTWSSRAWKAAVSAIPLAIASGIWLVRRRR